MSVRLATCLEDLQGGGRQLMISCTREGAARYMLAHLPLLVLPRRFFFQVFFFFLGGGLFFRPFSWFLLGKHYSLTGSLSFP